MKEKALIPILDAIYQRDQAELKRLKRRKVDIASQKEILKEPLPTDAADSHTLYRARTESAFQKWRQSELTKLARMDFELQPEVDEAKRRLKKSFGRLEALKSIVEGELR